MRVIIVFKTTNLETYGDAVKERVNRGLLASSEWDQLKAAHDEHYATLEVLRETLTTAGVDFEEHLRENWRFPLKGQGSLSSQDGSCAVQAYAPAAVIAVGGDGTVLSASHHILDGLPLIGLRSSRYSIGYLCAGAIADVPRLVDGLVQGTLPTANVSRLCAMITQIDMNALLHTVPVLNDLLYTSSNPTSTTRYRIRMGIGTKLIEEDQKSSGIWISTAVGSTAGINAAGGEQAAIEETPFQYRVRELYCPSGETYQLKGGKFDPDGQPFTIENRCQQAALGLDGQHGAVSLGFGDLIEVRRAPSLTLARPERWRVVLGSVEE